MTEIKDGLREDDGRMINDSLKRKRKGVFEEEGRQRVSERTAAYVQSPRY